MVKTTWQNIPVDRRELVSVVAIQCWGLTVNFDGLSDSSFESASFPCQDQGGREVKIVSRVPEVITHSSCRCSPNVVVFLEPDSKRSSRLTDVILFTILALNFVDHFAFLLLGCGVLWVYLLLSYGVKRLMASADSLFSEDPCELFRSTLRIGKWVTYLFIHSFIHSFILHLHILLI